MITKRLAAPSTICLPFKHEGHVFYAPRYCTVLGLYNETTGTIIFDSVLCDGVHYESGELPTDEIEMCYEVLTDAVLALDF